MNFLCHLNKYTPKYLKMAFLFFNQKPAQNIALFKHFSLNFLIHISSYTIKMFMLLVRRLIYKRFGVGFIYFNFDDGTDRLQDRALYINGNLFENIFLNMLVSDLVHCGMCDGKRLI